MNIDDNWSTAEPGDDGEAIQAQRNALREAINLPDHTQQRLRALREWLAESEPARRNPAGPGGRIEILGPETAIVAKEFICADDDLDALVALLGERGVHEVEVVERDDRLGVVLLRANDAGQMAPLLDACTDAGLCVGPNSVTMQASWRLKALGWPEPSTRSLGNRSDAANIDAGNGVIVAVIDGGFAPKDPGRTDGWLDDVWGPADGDEALDADAVPGLDAGAGHGTFVAGVVRQVAPAASIRQYRVLNSCGFGSQWRLKNAIMTAVEDGCQVINLSVGNDPGDYPSPALTACLHTIPDQVVVVAASGNAGSGSPTMPASHHRVLAVGALEGSLSPARWSNHGPWLDFSCVGEGIVSTFVTGSEPSPQDTEIELSSTTFAGPNPVALWSGTSFAAPQISGRIADLLAASGSASTAVARLRAQARAQVPNAHPAMGYRLRIL
jgi:hypothetical protein